MARATLLARSDRALRDLPQILQARGFEVREVVAYRTVARADGDVGAVREALGDAATEVTVFVSSPSAVEAFVDATGDLAERASYRVAGEATAAAVRARLPLARIGDDEEVDVHVAHG